MPLAIDVGKLPKISNVNKIDMDEEDLDDNINQIADEVDLSPKKIS